MLFEPCVEARDGNTWSRPDLDPPALEDAGSFSGPPALCDDKKHFSLGYHVCALVSVMRRRLTWSWGGRSRRTVAAPALAPGTDTPAYHWERSGAPRSPPRADAPPTATYAAQTHTENNNTTTNKWYNICEEWTEQEHHPGHLLLRRAPVLLQHLQQVIMFSIKLCHLLPVELQQLAGRPQIRQTLRDGGQRRLTLRAELRTDPNTAKEDETLKSVAFGIQDNVRK